MPSAFQERVYTVVRAIPSGRVLSYGAVAALAGSPRAARGVGAALSALKPGHDVPWWRVINASGRITTPRIFHVAQLQRQLLEDEGIELSESGRVDMKRYAWSEDHAFSMAVDDLVR